MAPPIEDRIKKTDETMRHKMNWFFLRAPGPSPLANEHTAPYMPRLKLLSAVSVGKLWAEHVVPLKQLFIDSGMPADFIEKLNAASEKVQQAIQDQAQSNGARLKAAIAIQHTRSQAVSAVRRLDPIMDNLLRDDPPVLAVWQRARRMERSNSPKPVEEEASPPPAQA